MPILEYLAGRNRILSFHHAIWQPEGSRQRQCQHSRQSVHGGGCRGDTAVHLLRSSRQGSFGYNAPQAILQNIYAKSRLFDLKRKMGWWILVTRVAFRLNKCYLGVNLCAFTKNFQLVSVNFWWTLHLSSEELMKIVASKCAFAHSPYMTCKLLVIMVNGNTSINVASIMPGSYIKSMRRQRTRLGIVVQG
jgi:hypothetical protein